MEARLLVRAQVSHLELNLTSYASQVFGLRGQGL